MGEEKEGKVMSWKEIVEKYGDVEVQFDHYYKFSFSFLGRIGEREIVCYKGGSADEIYDFEIDAEKPIKIKDLYPHAIYLDGVRIYDGYIYK